MTHKDLRIKTILLWPIAIPLAFLVVGYLLIGDFLYNLYDRFNTWAAEQNV